MGTYKRTSLRCVFAVIVCAFLACFVTAAATLFGGGENRKDVEVSPVTNGISAASLNPHRNYSEIEAEVFAPDVVFYNNFSTVDGIKENLTVSGVYNGKTYALSPDEFYITIDGLDASNKLEFPTNPETLTVTVCVPTGSRTLTAQTVITIVDDLPTFTAVTASGASSISNDYTESDIKTALTVKGTVDGKQITVNRELYSVALSALNAGSTGAATLTFVDGVYSDTVDVTFASVTAATVKSISITPAAELTLENGYYKKGEYSAFVEGMAFFAESGKSSVFSSLDVYVFYDNTFEKASFDAEGNISLSNPAGVNALAQASMTSAGGNQQTVTLTVTLEDGTPFSDSITLPFESKVVTAIEATYVKPDGVDVNTYTAQGVVTAGIKVYPVYNDGSKGNSEITAEFFGSLAPNASDYEAHKNDVNEWTYNKDYTVSYNVGGKTVTCTVTITDIKYVTPTSVDGLVVPSDTGTQIMTYPFDFTGCYLVLKNGRTTSNMSLIDMSTESSAAIWRTIQFYDDDDNMISGNGEIVPKNATSADITVHYDINGKSGSSTKSVFFTVLQAPVDYPTASEFVKDYGEECSITLSGVTEHMSVSHADANSATYVDIGENNNGEVELTFNAGGEFFINVVITDGADGVYRFKDVIGESNIEKNGQYTITYRFVINKGVFDLSLAYATDQDEWVYGGTPGTPVVRGVLGGRTYTIKNQDDQNGLAAGELGVPYLLYYYGFDGRTYDDIVGKSYSEIESLCGTLPEDVGEYYVVVITKETSAYAQSVAHRWNSHVVKITQKPLTLAVVNNAIYTRGTLYSANDVINTSSFEYGHNVTDVLTVSATGTPFTHAGSYDITITLTNSNYKWADGVTTVVGNDAQTETTFTIAARALDFTVSVTGFTYGDTPTLSPTFSYKDTASGAFGPAKNNFYAIIGSPVYYHADSTGAKTGSAIDLTTEPMNKWRAGKYYVEYTTTVDTASGDNATDYNTPTAGVAFDVQKKSLGIPTFTGASTTYDGNSHTITIGGYDDIADALMNGETFDDVFTVTTAAVRVDNDDNDTSTNIPSTYVTRADDTITYTEAGSYIVTIAFKATDPNYKWSDGTVSAIESNRYVLTKKELSITGATDGGNAWTYTYDGAAHTPSPDLVGLTGHTVSIVTNIYTDSACTATIAASSVKNVGQYWIKVENYSVTASGVSIDKANYKLPATTVFTFHIVAADLNAPVLKDQSLGAAAVSTVYDGGVFSISEFIDKWATDFQVGGADKVDIAVYAGDGTASLKDVFYKDGAVSAYKVYIYPKNNYKWNTGVTTVALPSDAATQAYVIDFTITQLDVDLAWTSATLTSTYSGSEQSPTVSISNKKGSDVVSVVIGFKQNGVDATAKNAGKYTAYAKSLDGAQKGNYKISSTNPNIDVEYVIKKKLIASPVLPTGADNAFNGTSGSKTVEASDYAWSNYVGIMSVSVSGEVPSGWFVPSDGATAVSIANGGTFTVGTGTFAYTRAGEYTFTVSLDAYGNYCFDSANEEDFTCNTAYTYTPADKFTVGRKQLTAPDIHSSRAQEWTAVTPIDFGTAKDGATYSVTYGNKDGSVTASNTWLGGTGEGVRGIYYAELTLTAADPLNYVWVENTADTGSSKNGLDYVDNVYAEYCYSTGKVSIKLYYAITSSQIEVNVVVNDYMFGDNGIVDGTAGNAAFVHADALTAESTATVYINGSGVASATGNNAAKLTGITFVDESGAAVFELVNGLPWTVGTYTLKGTLTFGNGETYQSKNISVEFTVSPRAISVGWANTSLEYNADSQMATATISTIVKKSGDDTTNYTAGLTLAVGQSDGSADPVNADSYSVKVTAINAADGVVNNFTLPATALTTTLQITAKAVTVKGTAVASHVYRDSITDAEKQSNASTVFYADGAADFIEVKILDDAGNAINNTASVATYRVVVGWKASAGVHKTNYTVTFQEASFTIVKRTLTVEFNSANAVGEYGDAVNLYDASKPIYTVTDHNGKGNALGGLATSAVFVFTCSADADSAVGDYAITPSAKDPVNFDITFVDETSWQYSIVDATIKEKTNGKIEGVSTTYSAADINVLKAGFAVQTKKDTPATWEYAFVNSSDVVASAVASWTQFTQSPTVYNAGDYYMYVRVTAENHDPLVKLVTVHVAKAELTVSVSFDIMYGEANPVTVPYKMSLADLRTDGGMYTVAGLLGNDETLFYSNDGFYNLAGTVEYTVDGFTGAVNTYDLTFKAKDGGADTLTCDNYTFVSAVGTLTVKKIKLTVNINNQSVVYHTEPTGHSDLTAEGANNAYTVVLPKSTYDGTQYISLPDGKAYVDIFTLSSAAVTNKYDLGGGKKANTAGVGDYPIIGINNIAANYEIDFVGAWNKTSENRNKAGIYTVTAAALDMSVISGYDIDYDEQYHGLIIKDSLGNATSVIAKAIDGSSVTVRYYESTTEITDFDSLGSGSATMPSYIDAGTYYVAYRVTAVNHTVQTACVKLQINKAGNEFVTPFSFANGKQYGGDIEEITDANAAWVYGLYGSTSTNGYNKNGNQAIAEPQTKFARNVDGSTNVLSFGLSYSMQIDGTYIVVYNSAATAKQMFEDGFVDGVFKAGYYKLTATMQGNANYTPLSATWVFKVAKRDLSVSVDDVTVMYGDGVSADMYVGKYDGLVKNSANVGAATDTITDAIGNTPDISTDYVVGKEVGTYTITVTGGQSVNYNVTFVPAALKVTPREVTITIGNKESIYNLQGETAAQTLTFEIVGTKLFYNVASPSDGIYDNTNQSVIVLETDALTGSYGALTNDVIYDDGDIGGYTIYAVYKSDFAKKNYVIKFADCEMRETRDGAISDGSANNAGKYTIKQATFSIRGLGVFHKVGDKEVHTDYYSGAQNYYKAQFIDNSGIEISFTYSLKGDSNNKFGSENVVNVGDYTAYAFTENTNYTAGSTWYDFSIRQNTLTLTAKETTIEYGTPLPNTYTAERFGGFDYTAHSIQITDENGEEIETLTPETLSDYIDDHPVTFTSSNYTPKIVAGTALTTIVPVCSSNNNVQIVTVPATLRVVKRNVTVTVVGYDIANDGDDTAHNSAAWCYYQGVQASTQARLDEQLANNIGKFVKVDSSATFGASGDNLAALGVKLALPNDAVNVTASGYGMTVYSDASNYNIGFVTSRTESGVRQNRIEYNAVDAPVFMIKKAPLTLYANVKNGENAAPYSVVYGSTIELQYASGKTLAYEVVGMKNGEQFSNILIHSGGMLTYTVMCGNKAYAAWESTTQETYTVTIAVSPVSGSDEVVFGNYEITLYKTAQLSITKLTIEASTVNQIFEKAADGYHGGLYGKAHEAVITFAGVENVAANAQNINVNYRPSGFTLTYDTKTMSTYQTAGKAPTVVGDYHVTVELSANGNYMFAGGAMSATLPFSVTKRVISDADLVWSRTQIATETESLFENNIANYIYDIMTINSFMFQAQYGGGRPIENGTSGEEYYTFGSNGSLIIHFGTEHGTYEVNFSLKSSATQNYVFESKNGTAVISTFTVSGDQVIMTVKVSDFMYRDTPSTPEVTINGSAVTLGLVFTYGRITDTSNIADYVGKGEDFGGFEFSELAGLKYDTLKAVSSFDAGYYVLYAYHPESSQSKYYVFRVNERAVDAPVIFGNEPTVYNGLSQQLAFEYDLSTVRAQFTGSYVQTASGSVFYATNKGDYPIQFILVDPANYKWADSVANVTDGVLTYTWSIAKDDAEKDDADPYIYMPTVTTLVFGQEFSRDTAEVRTGYEGNIVYYSMSKSGGAAPAVDDPNWRRALPSDADEYWIKAVVSDGNVNFTDKAAISSLVINSKQITATAYGSMTYGDAWSADNFRYTVDGLLYGDKVTENAQLKARLFEDYGTLAAGGEYYIILNHDNDGVVLGLDAGKNYVIKAVQGQFTVYKRDVTVTIDSLSGYYTVAPDVTDVGYTVSNLASSDDKSALGIVFVTDATNSSDAGGQYWITAASYDNSNYNVTNFDRGVYTVMRLPISVQLTEQTNLVYGDSGIVGATMGDITSDIAGADIAKVRNELTLSFVYSGMSFGGVEYSGTTAPTAAGNYTVTLVGVNDNYTLVGSSFVEFTIAKSVVDVSALSIANQPYSGDALTPVVSDGVYGTDIYTVSSQTFTDAGSNDVWLTLVDSNNYRWSATDEANYALVFVIDKIADALDGALSISGWQYGAYDESVNSPSAAVMSGERIVYQYSADGENYTALVPENGNAGTYYVRVFVAGSKNYLEFISEPVQFVIARHVIYAPSLTIVTEGSDKNDVYTGSDLSSAIVGFNPQFMQIAYDGRISASGSNVTVFAHDADVYTVYISLFNSRNYCWSEGDADNDGTIVLEWSVARKKVAKPTHDDSTKMVNGGTIVYIPVGFDPSVMEIENNAYSYGGTFYANIVLKDTKNYEWDADGDQSVAGDDQPFTIEWTIVGADPVFNALISVLSVLAAAGLALILVQILLNKRKKRMTANAMRDIETGEAQGAPQAEQQHDVSKSEDNEGGAE